MRFILALTLFLTSFASSNESFESAPAAPLTTFRSPSGTWQAEPGNAEITAKFAHTGQNALHIHGGENHHVIFTPAPSDQPLAQLSFQAERWTRRPPFKFRIEARTGDTWTEIYNGDTTIKVGARFLTHVTTPVPADATQFRLTSTAPELGGILIDDVRLSPAVPMTVTHAATVPVRPVLINKPSTPTLHIHAEASGSLAPKTVHAITVSTAGTTSLTDIKSLQLHIGDLPFGKPQRPAPTLTFTGNHKLTPGSNTFTLSTTLNPDASLDHHVATLAVAIRIDGEPAPFPTTKPTNPNPIGLALRQRGQDNCHSTRIPGLATTNAGTLIAVYDNRYRAGGDLPGDIDVGMSRSTDGGQTWDPMRVIMDMGDDPDHAYDGIGDPAILVDRTTGTIWVAATWSHGNRSWHGSGPGLTPDETGQLMLAHSTDDGRTWSKPTNITTQIKNPDWRFVLQGPGKGISLRDGTLVFPAQFRGENTPPVNGKPFSTLIYSRDHGTTWHIGTGVKIDTTEAQIVELADGSIMINCRDNRGGSRSVYTTTDLGQTWTEHPTSRSALPEPVCMASLIRVDPIGGSPLLFFSNPDQTHGRQRMTIKASNDEGLTWPEKWHTLIDEGTSMYSCMTQVGTDKIGLLYETPGELNFVTIPIRTLFHQP